MNKPVRTDRSGDGSSPEEAVFPVIVVFVQFPTNERNDYEWPNNGAPVYLDSFISAQKDYNTNWWDAYSENTEPMSDFWLEASRGLFHVTGKAYSVILSKPAINYASDHEINLEIWQNIKNQGLNDWKPFDKWRDTLIGGVQKFIYQPDKYVDMIYKIHKSAQGPMWNKSGYAHLTEDRGSTTEITVDSTNGVKIMNGFFPKSSGVTLSFSPRKNLILPVLTHEHGHCLYADGHIQYGKVLAGPGRDWFFSPYEMKLLGYSKDSVLNYSTTTDYSLKDFSGRDNSKGYILNVPIDGDEFFLIANRRKVSTWDRIMLGDTAMMDAFKYTGDYGKGVYIYHVKDGVNLPRGNESPQDLECADGLWSWKLADSAYRVVFDAGYCYETPNRWKHYVHDEVSYQNDDGNFSIISDGLNYIYQIWGAYGKLNSDICVLGTNGLYSNSKDIISFDEVLGDRFDPWNVGYNEVFSPYSSPSTKGKNNDNTGIFIWNYSLDGNDAKFKIYKASENGGSTSLAAILEATPPSRPMGIVVDYYLEGENYMRPQITWNHNKEPDMLLSDTITKKRYKIWRATQPYMSAVPTNYILLKTLDIDSGTAPSYIDTSIVALGSAWPGMGEQMEYPVRYTVQAIDKYQDSSVRSDFGSIIGLLNCGYACAEGPDNIVYDEELPRVYSLSQNYPNPFNPSTNIQYEIPNDNFVTIKIYNLLGKEVMSLVNDFKKAGRYIISFNGSNLSSGVYYYKISAGNFQQIRKMVLIK